MPCSGCSVLHGVNPNFKKIPSNILTLSCSVLSKPLDKLINFSFSEGTFPDLLKFANAIPVFKNEDNLDYNNYRPMSLISNIGKLIENIVHDQRLLEKNSLLFKQHYGFRNKLSANVLINTTNRIQEACDNGQYACVFCVYFIKDFDTVNHHILLDKLADRKELKITGL